MGNNKEKRFAEGIINLATYTVENSVGKCWPALAHEVKMPDSVRREYLHKDRESEID